MALAVEDTVKKTQFEANSKYYLPSTVNMSARGRSAEVSGDNGDGVADGGPGLAYMSFVVMEDLLDKLKLLNYEEVNKWSKF